MRERSIARALALHAVLAGALTAVAETPTAVSTRPAGPVPGPFVSLKALQKHFDEQLEQSRKAIETQRLASLKVFVENTSGAQQEEAMATMVTMAVNLEEYDRAAGLSDEFLKKFPKSSRAAEVRGQRLAALIESGRIAQARQEWETLLKQPSIDTMNELLVSGIRLGETYADLGQADEAKAVYASMKQYLPQAFPQAEREMFLMQLEQVLAPRVSALGWIGQAPPELEGKDLEGQPVSLTDYKGKVVLLDFWATWCRPCLAAMPELLEVYERYHDQGFEIIGISLDADEESLRAYLQQQKLPWRQVWDNQGMPGTQNPFGGPNTRKFDLSGIPATFLIDRDGKIARSGLSGQGLRQAVSRVLSRPASKPK
jgi:peroxiredoxin